MACFTINTEPEEAPLSKQEVPETTEQYGDRGISRRELLRRAGMAGAVAAVPAGVLGRAVASMPGVVPSTGPQTMTTQRREALETLTSAESETLEAIVARLIPSDASGPGAAEARAAHYIDHALAGPLASSREAYAAGLAALNAYAQTSKGAPFARLSPADQDAVLTDMEQNVATGFTVGSAAFFGLVRAHTIQGTFCDPYYGGNANFVGWDLIGYPGVRTSVTADQQRTDSVVKPNHRSAYDYDMFGRRSGASPGTPRDQQHGR
jgi:gluconate 2-dehydrogenase gamma chain